MLNARIRRLALGGMLTAIIAALTAYVRIGISGGYLNAGDCAVSLSAVLIGPYAALPAALGSAMADLLGYPQYALFSFVIKGVMGLIAGLGLSGNSRVRALISVLLSGIVLVGGYFLVDVILGGTGMAILDLPWNLLQFVLFAVTAMVFRAANITRLIGGR